MTGHDKAIVNRICASFALLAWILSALAVFASEPWGATALFTAVGGGICVAAVAFIVQRATLFVFAQIFNL